MDIVDIFLGRAQARKMCGDLLPQIDKATIQKLETAIDEAIAHKSSELNMNINSIEDLVAAVDELQREVALLKSNN